jgi:DNA sulfur modification protein DndB
MATYIPAMRAKMGDLDYFVSTITFGEAARMIEYVEAVDSWTPETPPELKLQRKLNTQRVERELVPYLLSSDDHFYSALTVEIRPAPYVDAEGEIAFDVRESFPGGLQFGTLTLDGTESLYALDGQHRLKSIELAVRRRPELAREHIALILVPFRSIPRSQTLFSDLNRYAKGPSKSMSLLFTHREGLARIAKALAQEVPLLRDRVNMESTSLSSNSRQFITLSTLYEMTRTLVGGDFDEATADEAAIVGELAEFWSVLTEALLEWRQVADRSEHPAYLRQRYLHLHGVAQQAIALAAARARSELGDDWRGAVRLLGSVDWRLTNPEWQGKALHGGRVNNTPTSIRLLAGALQQAMGLEPSAPSGGSGFSTMPRRDAVSAATP